jgi:hypothetical protein
MAVLPLNTFKTIPAPVTEKVANLYTCPIGVTAIVLLAQVSNISSTISYVTFNHFRLGTATSLAKSIPIPGNDALAVLTGRLVLQSGDSIQVNQEKAPGETSVTNPNSLQIVVSLVESANA